MFSPNPQKSISFIATTLGILSLSNLLLIDSANAFSVTFDNSGFENDITNSQNSWNTVGDVTINPTIDGVSPTNGLTQAIITTGYRQSTDSSGTPRNDDNSLIFNNSANEPVNADTNAGAALLQNHFDFGSNVFSIDRSAGATFPGTRISKEGSGMYQDFSVTLDPGETSFQVSFDWAYLSNDGTTSNGGNQDFAFWNLGQINGNNYSTAFSNTSNPDDEIIVLKSSDTGNNFVENITPPTTVDNYLYEFDYDDLNNSRYVYTVDNLTEGQTYNYRLGYGVVDVDGLERTSTLLVDNILIEQVPFKFSPTLGLLFVGSLFGVKTAWEKSRKKVKS